MLNQPPIFMLQDARRIAFELYGLRASARMLPGERDYNFHLKGETGQEFVLKIAPAGEQRYILDLQNKALEHLAAHDPALLLPRVCVTAAGESTATITSANDTTHFVRLLSYVPGRLFAESKPHTPELLCSLGSLLGRMDRALQYFTHPAAQRLSWAHRAARTASNHRTLSLALRDAGAACIALSAHEHYS